LQAKKSRVKESTSQSDLKLNNNLIIGSNFCHLLPIGYREALINLLEDGRPIIVLSLLNENIMMCEYSYKKNITSDILFVFSSHNNSRFQFRFILKVTNN